MGSHASLIPELEDVVRNGSSARRAEMLRRIATLFIDNAGHYREDHVGVFDDVVLALIAQIESKALVELSLRLAPVANAPREVVRRLARNDDIAIAGPVLRASARLADTDLIDVARNMSQQHLLAISSRRRIDSPVTDVLVDRGNAEVVRMVAANRGANLSERGFGTLVRQAERDGGLAEQVGGRPDIPPHLFRELVMRATDTVRDRLLAMAHPNTKAEIRRVLLKISDELNSDAKPRDYTLADRHVRALHAAGKLDAAAIGEFAAGGEAENVVAALALLCGVRLDIADRLICGEHVDPVLILCRAAKFDWATTCAVIGARPKAKPMSRQALEDALANFDRLSRATAQRVVQFWRNRAAEARAGR
ncbi:MAG: DUF2336 domain-containing protein [Proteobacteria bacterium]|nr:DUF2336 domain-containing protein [Pseudomonadota bacterium]